MMSQDKTLSEFWVVKPPVEFPRKVILSMKVLVVIGFLVLLAGTAGYSSKRIWQAYLINFVFWSSVAQGGVIFSAAYRMTNGRWGESIRRIAEGFVLFLPLSVIFFLITIVGRQYLWPWIQQPIPEKAEWLNQPFFFLRVTGYFLVLALLSLWYVYHSIRPELGLWKDSASPPPSRWLDRLTKNWQGYEVESLRSESVVRKLVPILLVAYAVFYSLVGFDVVMSLDPHWYSTLYGWLYFVHAFFAGLAALLIIATLIPKYFGIEEHLGDKQFYDASRLLMGWSMLAGGFYWSQYIVIWYGNLGEEIERMILRFNHAPWAPIQWIVIVVLYFFPLVVFLSRRVKEKPRILLIISIIILIGNWLYQFIEIAPSIWNETSLPIGWIEISLFGGFLGAFALCWIVYAKVIPLAIAKTHLSSH